MTTLRRAAIPETLFVLIWLLALSRIAWPGVVPVWGGASLMIAYGVFVVGGLRRQTMVLCAVLAALAVPLAIAFNAWDAALRAVDGATIFPAFFGTIIVLRATADRRPETANARRMFDRLNEGQRSGAFLVASHLAGSILVVGVMAVLAPILGPDATDAQRRRGAEVCQRGMCLAPLWSPFWIAMAVAYQHLPAVPLWQVMALGLPMAAAGLMLSHMMFARGVGIAGLWRAVTTLGPIVPPVALCAAVITGLTSFTTLTTLQSVAVAIPLLCAGALLSQGRRILTGAVGGTWRGVASVADEVVLMTIALTLGRVLEQVLAATGATEWIGGLALPPASLIALTVVVMTLTSLVGIHQVVSMTVMLVVLVPLRSGVADLVLMESALLGWGFASMVGISAVSVAMAGSMFQVPPERLVIGPNLKFVATYGVAAIVVLALVNTAMA